MSDKFGFWDDFIDEFSTREATSIDSFLGGQHFNNPQFSSMRELAQKEKKASEFQAGTRVEFEGSLEAKFSYDDPPPAGVEGTVVAVRTAHGNTTVDPMNRVFALWDDGKIRSTEPHHLKRTKTKQASNYRMVVGDGMDLSDFFRAAGGRNDELVHKATQDLWSLKEEGGNYVLERLFSEEGKPLKV